MTPQLMEVPSASASMFPSPKLALVPGDKRLDCAPGPHLANLPNAPGIPSHTRRSPLVRCEPGKAA